MRSISATVVEIEQIRVNKFEYSLRYDKNEVGWDIDVGAVSSVSVETTLQYIKQLNFVEIFALFASGLDLLDESNFGVFVDCVYFKKIRADSVVLFGP